MENSYLLELIKTLSKEEREELPRFIESPYFNRGKQAHLLPTLLKTILDAAPDFSGPLSDKSGVYQLLFPGQNFVEGKLEKVMAELNKLVRTFLLVRQYLDAGNEFQQKFDLAGILRKRNLDGRYRQVISRLEKDQSGKKQRAASFHYQQFQLEFEIHEWQSTFNQTKGDFNIPSVIRSLDIFYFIHRLELLNRFLLQQKVARLEMPQEFDQVLEENDLPKQYLNESIVLLITYKIFQLLRQPEPSLSEFQELTELLLTHEQSIEPDLLRQFYTYIRNFCVLLTNSGSNDLAPMLHQLQKDNLERGYLYYENKLTPSAYISVATAALRVKKFDWALEFVEAHRSKVIGDNETHDLYRFNRATCLFALGRYQEALDLIPETSNYTIYLLNIRRLELKLLYETSSDLLPYKIDAFKMFLSRASNKFLARSLREYQNNFVNLLQQLTHSIPGDKVRAERLIRRIISRKSVSERDWLLEKARQLA